MENYTLTLDLFYIYLIGGILAGFFLIHKFLTYVCKLPELSEIGVGILDLLEKHAKFVIIPPVVGFSQNETYLTCKNVIITRSFYTWDESGTYFTPIKCRFYNDVKFITLNKRDLYEIDKKVEPIFIEFLKTEEIKKKDEILNKLKAEL